MLKITKYYSDYSHEIIVISVRSSIKFAISNSRLENQPRRRRTLSINKPPAAQKPRPAVHGGMMRGEGAYEKASAVVKTHRWED